MTLQSVSLSSITVSKLNPRRKFDAASIEGLAASIKTDGLLQNLVVRPDGKGFAIISGERRYRALKLLETRGDIAGDFAVNVEVRDELSKDDSLRIATVENLQRANLTPLEETAALTKLVHKGVTLDDVAAQTGLSPTTIKRRLALANLCTIAAKALRNGALTLAQAEALTLGTDEAQQRVLSEIADGFEYSADDIRSCVLEDRPTVSLAIFPLEQYTGSITTDLFAESETSYFDDTEQFFALQQAAVEALAAHHGENAAWVEVTGHHRIQDWQYNKARKNQKGGVLINLSPSGVVEIREGLAKSAIDKRTAKETAAHPLAVKRVKASYAAPLCRYVAHHKTLAVQEVLLSSPRIAKEVAAFRSLSKLEPHAAIEALSREANPQTSYRVLETQASLFAKKLGFEVEEGESVWRCLPPRGTDKGTLYAAIKTLSDHDLDGLQALLTALSFGQADCERLDTGDSVFNDVARDLGVKMRSHWEPDAAFLSRRTHAQLVEIAKECGYAEGRSGLGSYKKSELVTGLLRHFEAARVASEPTAAQEAARAWLPCVMQFPAINPDASPGASEGHEPDADDPGEDSADE
ncbi:MAG: hypothetical protein AMXMBFR37_05960 [Steroidobacteraceae bacterium]